MPPLLNGFSPVTYTANYQSYSTYDPVFEE
jgi:hypothetical protein